MNIINKVAFLVHEPTMYAHYSSVWSAMEKDSFEIVLLGIFLDRSNENFGVKDFINKVHSSGYNTVYFDELVENKIKYRYTVSNHIMGGKSVNSAPFTQRIKERLKNLIKQLFNLILKRLGFSEKYKVQKVDQHQYFPLQVGIKQIRFMYGADISDSWSLDGWNEIYDLFLCHGPNDEMHLKKRFSGKTAIMGYPRYDGYFSPDINIDDLYAEFKIDKNKQTILWMPTLNLPGDDVCSIPHFALEVSRLRDAYNIIVRPHPITLREDKNIISLLESLDYQIDRNSTRDMNKLYKLADVVFCDYGGSAFGSMYLGKKMIILNTPNNEEAAFVKNSSNLEINECYPVVGVQQAGSIRSLLNNLALWKKTLYKSSQISKKYFPENRGDSSSLAANILNGLDDILDVKIR